MHGDYDDRIARARAAWQYRGAMRPDFARAPSLGQESVWDYPRPPAVVADTRHVTVALGGLRIADTRRAWRLLETASPPTFYLPWVDIDRHCLVPIKSRSFCEWKGRAVYWNIQVGAEHLAAAAWAYPEAEGDYADLAGAIAFYPRGLDCRVDGERVAPQPGGFYGGWVTADIVGPFKGEPGTSGW